MAARPESVIKLSPLSRADGSATFSRAGYTVVAAANGPIEAPRRDENPDEAIVDVILRPSAGVGGTRERYIESIIQSALRQIIHVRDLPRLAVQVSLQIMETPHNEYTIYKLLQTQANLAMIPALIHAAMLALISAALPLKATVSSTLIAVMQTDKASEVVVEPSAVEAARSRSIHVFAFTSFGDLILCESEGRFTPQEWEKLVMIARQACSVPERPGDLDAVMGEHSNVHRADDTPLLIRSVVNADTASALGWKSEI